MLPVIVTGKISHFYQSQTSFAWHWPATDAVLYSLAW